MSTGDAGESTTAAASAPARASRFARLRSGADRVPTRWFAGIATGVFLVATAAFGGLATAVEPPLPELEAGDTHTSAQVSLTLQRAFISDEKITGLISSLGDDENIVALVVDIVNNTDFPLSTTQLAPNVLLADHPELPPAAVGLLADTTISPIYQPALPATVVFAWILKEGTYRGGEDVRFLLSDQTLTDATFIEKLDKYWSPPVPAAYVTITSRILEPEVDE